MSPIGFDDVARSLAAPADVADALATPMPRRRALMVLAAGIGAVVLPGLAPRRAYAQKQPPPCSKGGRFCGNVNPLGKEGYNIGCCLGAPGETRTVCCPGIPGVVGSICCPTGYTCGNTSATYKQGCICPAGVVCGGKCCNNGEYCETRFLREDTCEKLCSHFDVPRCHGFCCGGNETCGTFGCTCASPKVTVGDGSCVDPSEDPGDPVPGHAPIADLVAMMSQTAASGGGGSLRAVFGRSAQSGLAGVDAALTALAAINGQGSAAMLAIRGGKRDPAFKRRVRVARVKPPTLLAGAGLDASSAAALNRVLVTEARAHALIAAMATALWRARAAHARKDRAAAKRQFVASATFADQAVAALKRVPALRSAAAAALTAGGVAERHAFDEEVRAFAAAVRSGGIPAPLRASMAALGVGEVDLRRLRTGVLDQAGSSAVGPVLIAPLRDPVRADELKTLVSGLSTFAARTRKHRLAR